MNSVKTGLKTVLKTEFYVRKRGSEKSGFFFYLGGTTVCPCRIFLVPKSIPMSLKHLNLIELLGVV